MRYGRIDCQSANQGATNPLGSMGVANFLFSFFFVFFFLKKYFFKIKVKNKLHDTWQDLIGPRVVFIKSMNDQRTK
jgi:hypothetical protein